MTEELSSVDWLVTRKLGPDDPMFDLDSIKLKIVCNQENKHFIKLANFLEKLTGKEDGISLRYMTMAFSVAYLIMRASQINPSTRIEIHNRFVKCIRGCIKTIAVIKPDAKERGKAIAKERRKKYGDTQSIINSHSRQPPAMHFMCPECDGPFKGEELARVRRLYNKRQQWMRTINTWLEIYKKKSTDGTNKLKDHFTSVGLEIEDYNVDALYKELNSCGLRTTKTKKKRKYPKKGEKLKSKIAEDIKIDLENEGSHVPDIPTNDPVLKDRAEDVLIYIRTFRTVTPNFNASDTPREDTFKEVARMNNTTEWEKIRDLVYKYCEDNDMDVDKTLASKEHKVKHASDEHDEHEDCDLWKDAYTDNNGVEKNNAPI